MIAIAIETRVYLASLWEHAAQEALPEPTTTSAQEHVDQLLESAEKLRETDWVVARPQGRAVLCVVEEFGRSATRTLVLNKRWLDALVGMQGAIDFDEYIDYDHPPDDDDYPAVKEGHLVGQTIEYSLKPLGDPGAEPSVIPVSGTKFWEGDDFDLISYFERMPRSAHPLSLTVRQHLVSQHDTYTGYHFSSRMLAAVTPHVNEIRFETTVA